jgi:hypothetical protein
MFVFAKALVLYIMWVSGTREDEDKGRWKKYTAPLIEALA